MLVFACVRTGAAELTLVVLAQVTASEMRRLLLTSIQAPHPEQHGWPPLALRQNLFCRSWSKTFDHFQGTLNFVVSSKQ